MKSKIKLGGVFIIECFGENGNLKWREEKHNLTVNVGLQHLLDVLFAGASQTATWYVGLVSSTPTIAAANTMASHAGWTEVTDYTEATRQTYTDVRTNQTVTNSAAPAVFNINNTVTVGGAFITSVNTKSGTTGTLFCAVAFTGGNRSVISGDVLNVTYSFTAADDGV